MFPRMAPTGRESSSEGPPESPVSERLLIGIPGELASVENYVTRRWLLTGTPAPAGMTPGCQMLREGNPNYQIVVGQSPSELPSQPHQLSLSGPDERIFRSTPSNDDGRPVQCEPIDHLVPAGNAGSTNSEAGDPAWPAHPAERAPGRRLLGRWLRGRPRGGSCGNPVGPGEVPKPESPITSETAALLPHSGP